MNPKLRTREAEEQRDVAPAADIAARVQRQDSALGHEVVHDGEHPLLHLARVLGACEGGEEWGEGRLFLCVPVCLCVCVCVK